MAESQMMTIMLGIWGVFLLGITIVIMWLVMVMKMMMVVMVLGTVHK